MSPPPSPSGLLKPLRDHLEDGSQLQSVRPLSGGFSGDTYELEGLGKVLRAEPAGPGLLPTYDMAKEYHFQRSMYLEGGPPVPQPLGLCLDRAVIGRAFYVMKLVRGTPIAAARPPAWLTRSTVEQRSEICREWVAAIAEVHLVRPQAVPGSATTPNEDADRWLVEAEKLSAPSPLLKVLRTLVSTTFPRSGSSTPLHGDPKLENCLWHNGRLTAVLDWELAGIGEPLTDLGYILSFFHAEPSERRSPLQSLEGWWSREQVISHWEALTGRPCDGLHRYVLLAMSKIATILTLGCHQFREGHINDPRLGRWCRALPSYLARMQQEAHA